MSIAGNSIPNFLGGVSQQPDKVMYPQQARALSNCLLSPTEGLCKRPPTEHIAKLCEPLDVHPHCHTIIKEDEEYEVLLTGDDILVYDLNGNKKTVRWESDDLKSYITTKDPLKELGITTIADYTFVYNKTVETALLDDLYPNAYPEAALIFIAQGDYACDYKIKVNGTSVASLTTSSTDADKVKTNYICSQLNSQLNSNLGTTDWNITYQGSVIALSRKDGEPFEIVTEDGNSDISLYAFYGKADNLNLLPCVAPNGFILKIVGENSSVADDYYVKFETADGSDFGTGSWKECPEPGIQYKIDASTMPHALVREEDGEFAFKRLDWTERLAGDEDSAPTPPFIGETIQKVFTHKGRLAFIALDRTHYSDTQDIFSFFRRTVLTTLDTDPIDVGSNSQMVLLRHQLPFNEELLLFSEKSQFSLKGGDVFSSSTVSCDLTMEYPCSRYCEPVNAGATAFFVFENGSYSRVLEVYITSTYVFDARDITEQTPSYLPKDIFKIACSTANNVALFVSTAEPNRLYCYNYYYSSEKKVQSAWSNWEFKNTEILNADFNENWLYLVTKYDDGIYLERMNLMPKNKEAELDFLFHLDRKAYITDTVYDEETNTTTLTLPYNPSNELTVLDKIGFPIEYALNGQEMTLEGTYDSIVCGNTYLSEWELSRIYVREQTENGGMKVKEGTLMLRDINLTYANAGYFRVLVTPKYSSNLSSEFEFTGKETGIGNSLLEKIPISDGAFLIPVIANNEEVTITVINDSYLPAYFLALEWLGEFVVRGQ